MTKHHTMVTTKPCKVDRYNRAYLAIVTAEVRVGWPKVKVRDASAWRDSTGLWNFEYQEFVWFGRAENNCHARAKGWGAWMTHQRKKEMIQ